MKKNLKLSPRELKKIWFKVPPNFYSHINQNIFQRMWHGNKLNCIHKCITQKPKKILDAGCADGSFLAKFSKLSPKGYYYGIDCYSKAIQSGRKRYPYLKLRTADLHKIPFRAKSFDLVILAETLEHVADPCRVMKELIRITKNDGVILVELDSGNILFRFIWFFWTNFLKGKIWKDSHLHNFNVEILENLFKKCRLKIIRKKFFNLGMAVCFVLKK